MKRVFLITGSPASGKSTYAKLHAGPKDIIFDLDEINKALGGSIHSDNKERLNIALAMRQAAIDEIAKRNGNWENAFFITASADRREINKLSVILGAEEIRMLATKEECKHRVEHDNTRSDKAQALALVEQWFEESETKEKSTREQFSEWLENQS